MKRTRRDKLNRVLAYLIVYGGLTLAFFGLIFGAIALAEWASTWPLYISLPVCFSPAAILLWLEFRRKGREE